MRSALIFALTIAVTLRASADPPDARVQARAHFRAGTAFYEAADYRRALTEFREAYRLYPVPDVLFNLAESYRQTGEAALAASYYRQYLTSRPISPVSDEARQHLDELERNGGRAAPAPSAPPPAAPAAPRPAAPTALPPPAAPQPPSTAPAEPAHGVYDPWHHNQAPVVAAPPPPSAPVVIAPPPANAPVVAPPSNAPVLVATSRPVEQRKSKAWIAAIVVPSVVVVALAIGLGVGLSGGPSAPPAFHF